MNAQTSVKVERTNFNGSWDDLCSFCGRPQDTHKEVFGPHEGTIYEHRMPCDPEKKKISRDTRRVVRTGKLLVLVGWICVPLAIELLAQTIAWVGWTVFGLAIFKLGIETVKHFGNPDKWIPGHKRKREEEAKHAHFIYHCERNPEGFARLRAENLASKDRVEN